jgi:hypothetical protein
MSKTPDAVYRCQDVCAKIVSGGEGYSDLANTACKVVSARSGTWFGHGWKFVRESFYYRVKGLLASRDGLPTGRDGLPAGRDVSTHTSEVPAGTGRGRTGVRFGTSVPVTGLTVIRNHHGGSLEISIFL